MKPERLLSADEEEQWQDVSRHIEWAERFSLIVLFVEDALLAESFKQRLQQQLQGRVSGLHVLRPANSETLTQDVFAELQRTLIPHAVVPCWLELHDHRAPEWQPALDNFFARFNERRDPIRREFPRPFIILLPLAYKSRLREIAPDLWSIRSHTDELRPGPAEPGLRLNHDPLSDYKLERSLVVSEQALSSPEICEWERVRDMDVADIELFLVADRAFYPALDMGQWSLAENLVEQLIALSHSIIEDKGENAWTLRTLGLSFTKQGDIREALGRYDAARQAYIESLRIHLKIKTDFGVRPEVLRDLTISLDKVAYIDEILGRYEAALAGYTESLQIRRELKASLGASPQVLRDLSVSLINVAYIDQTLGRYEAALIGYTESLQIRRRLKENLGATP
ncbi:MAG: tetratricopeptide repeat protein, partial [Methylobacter sp.]